MLFEALCIFPVDRANAQVWQTTILTSEEEPFRDQTIVSHDWHHRDYLLALYIDDQQHASPPQTRLLVSDSVLKTQQERHEVQPPVYYVLDYFRGYACNLTVIIIQR